MRKLLPYVSWLLLASCVSQTAPLKPDSYQDLTWSQRQNQLKTVQNWQMKGAIAVKQGKQAKTASYYWEYSPNHYKLEIFGILGIGLSTLTGDAQGVILVTSGGDRYQATSAEVLLAQRFGWQLPVHNLVYWIRGLPVPGKPSTLNFDVYQHLTLLQQQGWRIKYISYTRVDDIDLPSEIELSIGDLFVKLLINSWSLF